MSNQKKQKIKCLNVDILKRLLLKDFNSKNPIVDYDIELIEIPNIGILVPENSNNEILAEEYDKITSLSEDKCIKIIGLFE